MKRKYEEPEMEMLVFDAAVVITGLSVNEGGDGDTPTYPTTSQTIEYSDI